MDIVNYAEFLVKSICKEADLVKVSQYESEDEGILVDILIPESSMGSVIGNDGRNAKAIRILLNAFAYIHKLGPIKVTIDAF